MVKILKKSLRYFLCFFKLKGLKAYYFITGRIKEKINPSILDFLSKNDNSKNLDISFTCLSDIV